MNPKINLNPKSNPKKPKVYLRLKTLAMFPSYFDYIFEPEISTSQAKARLRPEISPKFLSTLGPNAARTRPEKPGLTYNSAQAGPLKFEIFQHLR